MIQSKKYPDPLSIRGRTYKARPLSLVLKKIAQIEQLRLHFFQNYWKPWYNKCTPIGKFWGVWNKDQRVIFEFTEDTHYYSVANTIQEQALVADEDDLPLMATDPVWKDAVDIIERRMKGSLKLPRHQDLADELPKLQARDQHINLCLGIYKEILYEILSVEYREQLNERFRPKKLITIKRDGRTFHILVKNGRELELLNSTEILIDFNDQLPGGRSLNYTTTVKLRCS